MPDLISYSPDHRLIQCKRSKPYLPPVEIDVQLLSQAEHRIEELSFVTPTKAPELLTFFIKAFMGTHEALSALQSELVMAKSRLETEQGRILLEDLPEILKAKGLSTPKSPLGNEDIRRAVLMAQPTYQAILDEVHQLEALVSFIEGKKKAFEMAYYSLKASMKNDPTQGMNNPNLGVGYVPSEEEKI